MPSVSSLVCVTCKRLLKASQSQANDGAPTSTKCSKCRNGVHYATKCSTAINDDRRLCNACFHTDAVMVARKESRTKRKKLKEEIELKLKSKPCYACGDAAETSQNPLFLCDNGQSEHFQHLQCLNQTLVKRSLLPAIDDGFEFNCDRCVQLANHCGIQSCPLERELSLSQLLHCKDCDFVFHWSCCDFAEEPQNDEWPCPYCDQNQDEDAEEENSPPSVSLAVSLADEDYDDQPMPGVSGVSVTSNSSGTKKAKGKGKKGELVMRPSLSFSRKELAAQTKFGGILTLHHFHLTSTHLSPVVPERPAIGASALAQFLMSINE